jgi:hypothetical protein
VASGAAPYLFGRWPLNGQRDTALYLMLIKNSKLECKSPQFSILVLGHIERQLDLVDALGQLE